MKGLISVLMAGNALLFVLGAIQHAGLAIGPFSEPVIVPASIVELACAAALLWGVVAVSAGARKARRAAMVGNGVAITGVAIGMIALAAGAGPRTASNDLYHKLMLALAGISLAALLSPAGRAAFTPREAARDEPR